ncbi:MerR family transcriptional regulator [Archangium primigenium]|uniref:MerR family transcriptional regulator n=1 Tax=[Archangium] primigenium TaxID=2792470 RepID=UPI001959C079|nr:MerR family transcriptional regulator [Archangium primigenium]MBM7116205.1 MerR family transcriptional regulator [Archangium primigenium]
MEWSIQDIARLAGTTSRTLRHYDDVGLLKPSRTGSNGYRYYDQAALVRLQRILLLRELGLGLPAIAEVLEGQRDTTQALRTHLSWLREERHRLERRIQSVETTIHKLTRGEALMAEEILDGFDHSQHEQEVVERWGREAHDESTRKWAALSREAQRERMAEHERVAQALAEAHVRGEDVASDTVQSLVRRHYTWTSFFWTPNREAYINLGEMYVTDARFAAVYERHAEGAAGFIRDAMRVFAEKHLA